MSWYRWDGDDLVLNLRVQPKASRDRLVGPHGEDAFKVTLTAPPVDGKANVHLIRFLAKAFGVPRARVVIEHGESGRSKRVRIQVPERVSLPL